MDEPGLRFSQKEGGEVSEYGIYKSISFNAAMTSGLIEIVVRQYGSEYPELHKLRKLHTELVKLVSPYLNGGNYSIGKVSAVIKSMRDVSDRYTTPVGTSEEYAMLNRYLDDMDRDIEHLNKLRFGLTA